MPDPGPDPGLRDRGAGPPADHGRGRDRRRVAVLGAASLRGHPVVPARRLERAGGVAGGHVLPAAARRAAVVHRQYRLPPCPSPQRAPPHLPAGRMSRRHGSKSTCYSANGFPASGLYCMEYLGLVGRSTFATFPLSAARRNDDIGN